MTTTRELWENALTDLELSLPKAAFTTWFRDTHIVRVDEGVVYVGVPSQLCEIGLYPNTTNLFWLLCDVFLKRALR